MLELLDTTPRSLATALSSVARHLLDSDRESAAVLEGAAGKLQTIGWNRYARQTSRRSLARSLRRRHQQRRCRHA